MMYILENLSTMPSSNNRSSRTQSSGRTQPERPLTDSRASSVPQRQFTLVLTNNAELLRQTLPFQPQVKFNQLLSQ